MSGIFRRVIQWEIVSRLDGDFFGCNVMNTPRLGRSTIEDTYVRVVVQVNFVVEQDGGVERTKEIPIYCRIYSGRFQEYLSLRCKDLKVKAPRLLRENRIHAPVYGSALKPVMCDASRV